MRDLGLYKKLLPYISKKEVFHILQLEKSYKYNVFIRLKNSIPFISS